VKEISPRNFEAFSKHSKLLEEPNRKRKVIFTMFFEVYSSVTASKRARMNLAHTHGA
jgi:hypothetical protein